MNAMNVIDQYPSTFDLPLFRGLPPIAGGQDASLAILEGARKRYARSMSTDDYISRGGSVCAVGAVAREDGVSYKDARGRTDDFDDLLERKLTDAAKEAIDLLNEAAREICPVSEYLDGWSWPLEYINQELPRKEAKKTVLECYDLAISRRRNQRGGK